MMIFAVTDRYSDDIATRDALSNPITGGEAPART